MDEKKPLPKRISISQVSDPFSQYDILLVGEEHGNMDHYEKQARMLRDLTKSRKVILATEYFFPEHQLVLDSSAKERRLAHILSKTLDEMFEDKFTKTEAHCLYTAAVRLCERVVGINHEDFAKKDKFMADEIMRRSSPGALTLAFLGKLHTEDGRVPYHLRNSYANFGIHQL